MTAPSLSLPALRLVRLPGAFGPVLRCSGELSVATAESLRRELALLLPMSHSVFTLSLIDCTFVDVDGILAMLHTYKELRRKGTRMVVVAGRGRVAHLLHFMGIDRVLPMFPTEESAALAVRGGGPADPAPGTWEAARAETIARWRKIQDYLDDGDAGEALRLLTGMTALCERAEELFEAHTTPVSARCQLCPLFYELGGQAQDIGCRSVLDPIIAAVDEGEKAQAKAQIEELIRTLEEMPLAEKISPPAPWLPLAPSAFAVA